MNNWEKFINFLEGNETLFNFKDKWYCLKIPMGDGLIAVHVGDNEIEDKKLKFSQFFLADTDRKLIIENTDYIDFHFSNFKSWLYGNSVRLNDKFIPLREISERLGYKHYNPYDVGHEVLDGYKKLSEKLMKDYPDLESVLKDLPQDKREVIRSKELSKEARNEILRGEENAEFTMTQPYKTDNFALTMQVINEGMEKAVNDFYSEMLAKNLMNLGIYYKHKELAKEYMGNLDPVMKKKLCLVKAVKDSKAKTVTMVYNTGKIKQHIRDIQDDLKGSAPYWYKNAWEKISNYLDKHDKLVFKANTYYIGLVLADKFLMLNETDIASKNVLDIGYSHLPYDFEKLVENNVDDIVDIRYRNKSILG